MKNFYPVLNELPISCKYVEQRAKTRLGGKIKTESINSRISKISLLKSHSIAIEGWRIIEGRRMGREAEKEEQYLFRDIFFFVLREEEPIDLPRARCPFLLALFISISRFLASSLSVSLLYSTHPFESFHNFSSRNDNNAIR